MNASNSLESGRNATNYLARRPSRRAWLKRAGAFSTLHCIGCGYTVRPPYNREIRTVYVPIFRSLTFRRDLNLMLTEAVAKEIEKRTPYKVVGTPDGADSTLSGEVIFADKNLLVENPQNLPRQLSADLVVNVRWTDNRQNSGDPKDVGSVTMRETVTFSPEFGDTTMMAYQKACQKMAEQIASMMEEPW